jgi:hypothetical protein
MDTQPTKEYQWNSNWGHYFAKKTDVKKVVEEFEVIKETYGSVSPTSIVESARNKNSVLHGFFEWDDSKAAESYRKSEASKLLRQVEVKVVKDESPLYVRAYHVITGPEEAHKGNVKSVSIDMINDDNMAIVKNSILTELKGVLKRMSAFGHIEQFATSLSYVQWAIKILSKEEDPKEEPVLGAVSTPIAV